MSHRPDPGLRWVLTAIGRCWILVLPMLFLLPGLFSFPYPTDQAQYSDLAITHYPNAIFLRQAIATWHTIPLWSPTILSGYPFAANPLAGIWYLPGWLAYLLPLPFGFNLLMGLHLLFGGIGMYKLLQAEAIDRRAALFGGLAFGALPKLFAHYGAGHLTLLYALPWTPWLLLAWREPGLRVRLGSGQWRVPSGLILAMIFLADVRWAAYAGALWLGYALLLDHKGLGPGNRSEFFHRLKAAGWQVILAGLLSAPLALPLWEYSRLSTRAEMAVQDIIAYSLPPARLLGFIIPDFGGFHEYTLYPGLVVLVLGALGALWGAVRFKSGFWLWAAGISIIYALGGHLPLFGFVAQLPGFDLLRVPSRSLFITGIALIVLASHALGVLLDPEGEPLQERVHYRRRSKLFLAGLFAFVLIITAVVWRLANTPPTNFIWSCLMAAGIWIWYELQAGKRLASRSSYWVLIGLCLLDLGVFDLAAYSTRPAEAVLAEGRSALETLPITNERYRVYSPSYGAPQQTAALLGLELADGVDPLQLKGYVDFMKKASRISWNAYSVTLPAFQDGDPQSDHANTRPDVTLLGLLNVRYILSAFEQDTPGLLQRGYQNGIWIYENQQVLPRAWVQLISQSTGEEVYPVDSLDWSPNRISVDLPAMDSGPGDQMLVLSEIYYPGWRVTVDGEPSQIELWHGVLRSVRISAGASEVVFTFRPSSLIAGLVAAVLGWAFAIWYENRQTLGIAQ